MTIKWSLMKSSGPRHCFSYLQTLVDSRPDRMGGFILSGSQNFHLMERITQSLAGRVALSSCFHWTFRSWRMLVCLLKIPLSNCFMDSIPRSMTEISLPECSIPTMSRPMWIGMSPNSWRWRIWGSFKTSWISVQPVQVSFWTWVLWPTKQGSVSQLPNLGFPLWNPATSHSSYILTIKISANGWSKLPSSISTIQDYWLSC